MADDDLADDVLNGMSAICRFLNIKERQGYDLAEKGRLPLFKLGGRKWQARKSTLRKHIEDLEARGGVKQVPTRGTTTQAIMRSAAFVAGVDDKRNGLAPLLGGLQ